MSDNEVIVGLSYQLIDSGELEKEFASIKEAYAFAHWYSSDMFGHFSAEWIDKNDKEWYYDNFTEFMLEEEFHNVG